MRTIILQSGILRLLLQYAVKNETFEEIFCSREHFVESTDGHPEGLMMRNSMFKLRDDWTCGERRDQRRKDRLYR